MTDVFRSQDHHFNKIVQADLREILPEWLHPEVTEVVISATDPMVDDPTTELWYQPASGLPPVPPALWDVAVTYAAGDYALWPDPDHWQAAFTNTGREPGTPAPLVTEGYQFPGTASGQTEGVSTPGAGLTVGGGYQIRVKTNGALGDGVIFFGVDQSQIGLIGLATFGGTDLEARVRGTTQQNGYHQWRTPLSAFDFAARPYIAYKADPGANLITFQDSADGVTWNDVATIDTSTDAMAINFGLSTIQLGNNGLANWENYDGVLAMVELRDLGGALLTSWNSMTLASADGTGASPETGETYTQVGPTALVPGAQVPGPDAWVAVPAPTAGTGILRANVNGVWEEVTSAVISEVEVNATEPTGEWELWADTSAQGSVPITTTLALDDLSDVDLSLNRDIPAQGDALIYDQTARMWHSSVPAVALGNLTDVDVPPVPVQGDALIFDSASGMWISGAAGVGQFLPLAGGTMAGDIDLNGNDINRAGNLGFNGGKTIQFVNATGPKIYLYGQTFGIGVESGETSIFASSKVGFRANASNGTSWGHVDAAGVFTNAAQSTAANSLARKDYVDSRVLAKSAFMSLGAFNLTGSYANIYTTAFPFPSGNRRIKVTTQLKVNPGGESHIYIKCFGQETSFTKHAVMADTIGPVSFINNGATGTSSGIDLQVKSDIGSGNVLGDGSSWVLVEDLGPR